VIFSSVVPLDFNDLKKALTSECELAGEVAVERFVRVSTDTRQVVDGDLFFALKGEKFDAHTFLDKAVTAGARGLVVSELDKGVAADLVELAGGCLEVFWVDDTLTALQQLAHYCRKQMKIPVVGVTGSSGKTSTKDLLRSVLSQKYEVSATRGNLNNHIGLPLTILEAADEVEIAIWEMGMNHPGEIEALCKIGEPTHAVISSIGTAHIEFFENQRAIAYEKASVAKNLSGNGALFVPANTGFNKVLEEVSSASVCYTGGKGVSQVTASNVCATARGERFDLNIKGERVLSIELPVLGKHMVSNALLAVAVGLEFGLTVDEIKQGLESAELTSGRLQVEENRGISLIDDTYNANPDSMIAALEVLDEIASEGKKVAVFGRLGELGNQTKSGYEKVCNKVMQLGLELVVVGNEAKYLADLFEGEGKFFSLKEEAVDYLKQYLTVGDVALFKGSRAACMEEVLKGVKDC